MNYEFYRQSLFTRLVHYTYTLFKSLQRIYQRI